MTCVLTSPWQPFSTSYEWSPMNPSDSAPTQQGVDRHQHGYASSESESRQTSSSAGKKRASRAGTRSVTSLSTAQLERKRANDREAQRAIRQRTKDHIDHLERNISDLRAAQDASEKIVVVTQQRNRELEEENAYLRTKLGEAGYPINIPPTDRACPMTAFECSKLTKSEDHRPSDHGLVSVQTTSPAPQAAGPSIQRPDSTSTPRSALSLNTSQSASSRHGSWQQTANIFNTSAPTANPNLSATGPVQLGPNLSAWRSHESSPSVHSNSGQIQDPSQAPPQTPYSAVNPNERTHWTGTAPPYNYPDQQPPQQFEQSAQQQQYAQPPVQNYAPEATPQQAGYHAPPPPPQAEFQGMAVSSPAGYPVPQAHAFSQPAQYQMAPMQVSPAPPSNPEYASQQGHMQPPPIPPPPYPQGHAEQQYSQQQVQQAFQFREDPTNRGYSLSHYPSG